MQVHMEVILRMDEGDILRSIDSIHGIHLSLQPFQRKGPIGNMRDFVAAHIIVRGNIADSLLIFLI